MTGLFARRAAAPADRKVATGWVRSLDGSQAASRRHTGTGEIVVCVLPSIPRPGLFDVVFDIAPLAPFLGIDRDDAKAFADVALRCAGWRLADVVGGTAIEEG